MKLLFLHHQGHILDGSAKALLNNIICLKHKGESVCVILPNKGTFYNELLRNSIECKIVKYRILSYPNSKGFKNKILFLPRLFFYILINVYAAICLIRLVKNKRIDLIHTNVGPLQIGSVVAKYSKIPHVWHIREYFEAYGYRGIPTTSYYRKKLHKKHNHCIAITESIFKYNYLDKEKDCVIYDGVIHKEEKPSIVQDKERYILYVGGLIEQKGIDDLLEAYFDSRLSDQGVKLYIAGPILDSDFSRKMQTRIKMNSNIELLGFRTDIELLMKKALCLVIPSRQEGFGFVSIEAMRVGCPVIGRNVAGLKEQFDKAQDYFNQDIVTRFDDVSNLRTLFDSKNIYIFNKDLASRIQQYVIETYTTKVCVENIINYYNSILENTK